MNELEDYYLNLMADIRREADASGILMVEAFFEQVAERLTEAGELEVADRSFFQSGEGTKKLRIDGYAGDPRDSDGVLGLIVCDFVDGDDIQTFSKNDVLPLLNPLIRFLKSARTAEFRDSLSEVNPAFQVSDLLNTTWSQITKVKLVLVSNRRYTSRDDTVKLEGVGDIPMTWSVWDLARFERFDRAGQAREDIAINFAEDFGGALPALKASKSEAGLESYLLVVPGEQLAAVYDRWGARLLEANVRSFLQARAKTNKGIQKTIKEEPDLFFPYNNGLSATAEAVTCLKTSDGLAISEISNLQIVNGAQTTGSIHAALKSAKEQLTKTFVQMKLTVVPVSRAEEIVPKISEFANTQNKVNAADFFSNHPLHIRIERFSRSVLFTAREGVRHDSKWFYERSRGQFLNARIRLTPAQQKKFDLEFPKAQLFSKTDLAKFEFSASGKPHIVSRGSQKNFAEFAKEIGEAWAKGEARFDELWFRRLVSKAIMFRMLEMEVPKQPWYEGGYRANIVTYAIAKVFHDANSESEVLDLDTIHRRQELQSPLAHALLLAAKAAHDVITHPAAGIRNMSEWAKQQACWSTLAGQKLDYGANFSTCLILKEAARTSERDERKKNREIDGITAQTEVFNLGADFWRMLLERAKVERMLSPKEEQIVKVCANMPKQIPSELQAKVAVGVLERVKQLGLVVG